MRTTAHPRNMSVGNDPASVAAAQGQVGVAGRGGRKRRNSVPGGGTKRRAIGNVVRSAVREGRNIKRQGVAEAKRKAVAQAVGVATAAPAPGVLSNAPAPVSSQAPSAPQFKQANPAASAPNSQPKQQAGAKRQGKVPNPLPAVSKVLEPYVSTAATALQMRPAPQKQHGAVGNKNAQQGGGQGGQGNAQKQQRGRQQLVHTSTHGTLPMAALEDAVFRLLTPATGAPSPPLSQPLPPPPQQQPQAAPAQANNGIIDPLALAPVNKVPVNHAQYHPQVPAAAPGPSPVYSHQGHAHQGHPQGHPQGHQGHQGHHNHQGIPTGMSPTGVADMSLLPGWVDAKNPPQWYNDGGDIDTLLEDAECLNWLSDTGDLEETYPPAVAEPAAVVSSNSSGAGGANHGVVGMPPAPMMASVEPTPVAAGPTAGAPHPSHDSFSFLVDGPPDHSAEALSAQLSIGAGRAAAPSPRPENAHHLPSFLNENATPPPQAAYHDPLQRSAHSRAPAAQAPHPYASATEAVESIAPGGASGADLMGFPDLDMGDEQAFVSALLETSGGGMSGVSFPKLSSEMGMSHGNMHGQHCGAGSGILAGEEHVLDEN